jgi:hypothetical protein
MKIQIYKHSLKIAMHGKIWLLPYVLNLTLKKDDDESDSEPSGRAIRKQSFHVWINGSILSVGSGFVRGYKYKNNYQEQFAPTVLALRN